MDKENQKFGLRIKARAHLHLSAEEEPGRQGDDGTGTASEIEYFWKLGKDYFSQRSH